MNSLTTTTTQSSETVRLVVTEVIQDNLCIESEKAQKVYDRMATAFFEGKKVILDFKDCEEFTWGFLDDAIGQLYENFSEEQILSSLIVVNMNSDDLEFLKDVVKWAKEYLKNPERFREAAREFLGDDDE